MKPVESNVPKHIGIILDGNRRFARRLMMKPWKGHEWGAKKIEQLLTWASDIGIKELTLYAFSIQNMNRPKHEFDFLMDLFKKEFLRLEKDPRVMKEDIRINIIGRLNLLPKDLNELFQRIMEKTKHHKKFVVNFAIAYGGREEVIDAIMKLGKDVKEGKLDVNSINEEVFQNYLYTPSEQELVIRTGGDNRTSNFLIWQSNYAEWFFLEKTWPEFEKEDLVRIVEEFGERERRFGK